MCLLFLPFTYLFNDLLISEWINGYLFYTLGYNTIKFYFVAQIVPCFGHWELFHLVAVSLQHILFLYCMIAFLVAQMVKNLPAMWETQAPTLDWEDPLEKGMTIHSSILGWQIPRTEDPGRLKSMGSQRLGQDWATNTFIFTLVLHSVKSPRRPGSS